MMKQRTNKLITAGFTLIELLVVMAITGILLGLIFGPMIQGFNLTNRARVQVLAQDSARAAMELAQRDMSNAVFVFHHIPDQVTQLLPGETMEANSVSLWVRDSAGAPQRILVPYGMMDFVPPARAKDQNILLSSTDIDPTTGLALVRGDVALPLAPGRTITRYWLGLRNNAPPNPANPATPPNGRPALAYGNFYENTRELGLSEHNPVVLFRAVISPHMPNLTSGNLPQVDRRLFRIDATNQPVLYDPNFFYDNSTAGTVELPSGAITDRVTAWRDLNGDGIAQVCENWRAIATSMVPIDRADLVIAERDDQRRTIFFPNAPRALNLPRLAAQCKFQPTYVGNDAGTPSAGGDVNNEAPSVPPSAFRESSGHWTFPYRVFVYRSTLNAPQLSYFEFAGDIIDEGSCLRFNIREKVYDTATSSVTSDLDVAYRVDDTHYRAGRLQLCPGERPNIIFNVDDRRGIINFAVPHSAVLGWIQDPVSSQWTEVPAEFFPDEPNTRWANAVGLGEDGFRYVSLADMQFPIPPATIAPTSFNRRSPLEIVGTQTYIPNVSIVPGSEVVIGPDMRGGPHYGQPITYTRVPRSNDPLSIGPNEYMINYTDISGLPPGATSLPAVQRVGTIIFDSNLDRPGEVRHSLPTVDALGNRFASNIKVTYKIQNNLLSDIVKADYLTRELMTVALGIRLFEFNSGQPQQVTLTQKIKVRNLQR